MDLPGRGDQVIYIGFLVFPFLTSVVSRPLKRNWDGSDRDPLRVGILRDLTDVVASSAAALAYPPSLSFFLERMAAALPSQRVVSFSFLSGCRPLAPSVARCPLSKSELADFFLVFAMFHRILCALATEPGNRASVFLGYGEIIVVICSTITANPSSTARGSLFPLFPPRDPLTFSPWRMPLSMLCRTVRRALLEADVEAGPCYRRPLPAPSYFSTPSCFWLLEGRCFFCWTEQVAAD